MANGDAERIRRAIELDPRNRDSRYSSSARALKEQLFMSDDEIQNFIDMLTRNIGTQTATAQNRFAETAAYNDMPLASKLAGERGINYQSLLQTQAGTENIQNMASNVNRDAARFLLNQQFQAQQAEKNRDAMMWGSLFGGLGTAVGSVLGSDWFGKLL